MNDVVWAVDSLFGDMDWHKLQLSSCSIAIETTLRLPERILRVHHPCAVWKVGAIRLPCPRTGGPSAEFTLSAVEVLRTGAGALVLDGQVQGRLCWESVIYW